MKSTRSSFAGGAEVDFGPIWGPPKWRDSSQVRDPATPQDGASHLLSHRIWTFPEEVPTP